MTALQYTNPGFLKKIFRELAVAVEKDLIAVKTLLVLLDEPIQKIRVAAAQTSGER